MVIAHYIKEGLLLKVILKSQPFPQNDLTSPPHTDRFLIGMFRNCALKERISVENWKLWLLTLTKTLFYCPYL